MKVKNTGSQFISIIVDNSRHEFVPNQIVDFPDKSELLVDAAILPYPELVVVLENDVEGGLITSEIEDKIALVSGSGLNKTLSNLESPTSINEDLIPLNVSKNIGSVTKNFDQVFSRSIKMIDTANGDLAPVITILTSGITTDRSITIASANKTVPNVNSGNIDFVVGTVSGTAVKGSVRAINSDVVVTDTESSLTLKPQSAIGSTTITFGTSSGAIILQAGASGGGNIDVVGSQIKHAALPTDPDDVATKAYSDTVTILRTIIPEYSAPSNNQWHAVTNNMITLPVGIWELESRFVCTATGAAMLGIAFSDIHLEAGSEGDNSTILARLPDSDLLAGSGLSAPRGYDTSVSGYKIINTSKVIFKALTPINLFSNIKVASSDATPITISGEFYAVKLGE